MADRNLASEGSSDAAARAETVRGCCRIDHNGNVLLREDTTFDECVAEADVLGGTPSWTANTSCGE